VLLRPQQQIHHLVSAPALPYSAFQLRSWALHERFVPAEEQPSV
jgi:hypothetical protein